jgi:hypothetical protein
VRQRRYGRRWRSAPASRLPARRVDRPPRSDAYAAHPQLCTARRLEYDGHVPGHFHAFRSRVRKILREHAPDVLADVLTHGAGELIDPAPDGSVEPGDEDFVLLLCRRPVFEGVLRRALESEPNVRVMAGRAVTGLVVCASANPSVPLVRGVRLAGGGEMPADAVIAAAEQVPRRRTQLVMRERS